MRILIALTYYRPHYSGLTIYSERLATALAGRGHRVTVLTSRYSRILPRLEMTAGVRILRLPVAMRISKGVIMPGMPFWAFRQILRADVVNLHVPQLDAAHMALTARALGRPIVLTYHCDLLLPAGLVNRLAKVASDAANRISARAADVVVTNTVDYAKNSVFLMQYLGKVREIPPPVCLPRLEEGAVRAFRDKYGIRDGDRVIGMIGRVAAEKGAEYLARALPMIQRKHPRARVIHVGQNQGVIGEEAYARMLAPLAASLGRSWRFLGVIPDAELAAFFHLCDVVAVPSIKSTESFGIVQVEAMICGTPTVASGLPGMRRPVLETGMGRLFTARDVDGLAAAVIEILDAPQRFQGDVGGIARRFSPDTIAREYEVVFEELILRGKRR